MKILFYGNCQQWALKLTLNIVDHDIFHVECFSTEITEQEYHKIVSSCDVIITQIVNDNYRDKSYLSTNYILNNRKESCKVIIIDNCYFNFYYIDLAYKGHNNAPLTKPIDYHYNNMIEYYKNKQSVDRYIQNVVENEDFESIDAMENRAIESLNELLRRSKNIKMLASSNNNVDAVTVYDYVKDNYKNKLLFYSMNHPTKYMFHFLAEQIINILNLQNTINYDIDVLSDIKCILYKCIQKVVRFDIKSHEPALQKITDVRTIIQIYYNAYQQIGYDG